MMDGTNGIYAIFCVTVQSLHARQAAGAGMTASSIPTCLYSKVTMIDRKLGHLSSVYCVTYDRTGDFIITVSAISVRVCEREREISSPVFGDQARLIFFLQ